MTHTIQELLSDTVFGTQELRRGVKTSYAMQRVQRSPGPHKEPYGQPPTNCGFKVRKNVSDSHCDMYFILLKTLRGRNYPSLF